jgi:hypothetical protein
MPFVLFLGCEGAVVVGFCGALLVMVAAGGSMVVVVVVVVVAMLRARHGF